MIIFTWKDRPIEAQYTERARWVLDVSWNSISFEQQIKKNSDKLWMGCGRYYSLWFNKHWRWGRGHAYYDGPHDSFFIGFIHFAWSGDWCDKCYNG